MHVCVSCGKPAPASPVSLCYSVDGNGERVLGSGCYGAAETAEAVRLDALATAIGCTRAEVNPRTLAIAAKIAGCEWGDVTPAKLAGKLTVTAMAESLAVEEAK